MIRRNKVELFAQLRHEYEFGVGTVAGVARKFSVHRRLVRQALKNALPPPRKAAPQANSRPQEVTTFLQQILQAKPYAYLSHASTTSAAATARYAANHTLNSSTGGAGN